MVFCNLHLTSLRRMSPINLLLGFLFLFHLQPASGQIDVDPEFRATPIWYWKNPESKCIPVPSYDVISRIGPQILRKEGVSISQSDCVLRVMPRRVEAVLQCDAKIVEKFYSQEKLCREKIKSVARFESK